MDIYADAWQGLFLKGALPLSPAKGTDPFGIPVEGVKFTKTQSEES